MYILAGVINLVIVVMGLREKRRADNAQKRVEELEVKLAQSDNAQKKDIADAKLDAALDELDSKLNGDTSYEL